jgi:hypothetical protein
MARSLVLIALAAFASQAALASPFIVSDPVDPTVTHCGFKLDAGSRADVPIAMSGPSKICRLDIAGVAVGSHIVNATAVAIDTVWGRRESPASPNFTFSVPTIPTAPAGLGLQP